MAKISSTKDLPEWFYLERYRAAEDFTAEHWLEQLDRRISLFPAAHDTSDKSLQQAKDEIWWAIVSGQLTAVRDHPVKCQYARQGDLVPVMPVRAVSYFDLAMQAHHDEMAKREGICSAEKADRWNIIAGNGRPTQSTIKGLSMPIEIGFYMPGVLPQPVVKVDLGATDATLIEAFSTWLKEARSTQPVDARKPKNQLYKNWARYGILPYLDLLIWGMETDTQIIEGVYAAAIFPGQEDGKDRLKTTKKWAKSLMSDLSALQAIAAIEARSSAAQEIFKG